MSGRAGPTGPTGPGGGALAAIEEEAPASTIEARPLVITGQAGHGVVVDSIHWEHYCQTIEEMKPASQDDVAFYVGSATATISLFSAFIGVLWGTSHPSSYLISVLLVSSLASAVLTVFFGRRYERAKGSMVEPGKALASHMREVAAAQAEEKPRP